MELEERADVLEELRGDGFEVGAESGRTRGVERKTKTSVCNCRRLFLFSAKKKKNAPKKRSSAGMTLIDGSLYSFGGVNSKVKFDDFWKFDLTSKEWTQIESSGDKPLVFR